jgi:hypothetical protein
MKSVRSIASGVTGKTGSNPFKPIREKSPCHFLKYIEKYNRRYFQMSGQDR